MDQLTRHTVKGRAFLYPLWRSRVLRAAVASVAVVACSGDRNELGIREPVPEFVPVDRLAALQASDTLRLLPLRTYDGSGQSVHPDFMAPPASWNRQVFYLAVTPYPGGTGKYENPSLYAGLDGVTWGAAPGAPMPLAKPEKGHLSDPDLVFDPLSNELVLYYREASKGDRLFVIRSSDGVAWSKPTVLLTSALGALLSPAVVRRGESDWVMWSVNGAPGCHGASTKVDMRRSADGLTWSDPESVKLPLSPGAFAWHIDVQWIEERNEYWALFPVKAKGTCATKAVYLATSPDGRAWNTLSTPVLIAGDLPEFRDIVYRSTFAYDAPADEVTFWFSGARVMGKRVDWRTAVQRLPRSRLFEPAAVTTTRSIPVAKPALTASFDPP